MHCAITQRRWGKRRIRWRGHFKMCCALCVCGGCCVSIPMNDDGDYVGHCFINITYTIGCRLWSCVLRSIIIIYTAVWCVRRAYMLCAWMVDVPSIRWWILTTHQMCTQRSKHTQIFSGIKIIYIFLLDYIWLNYALLYCVRVCGRLFACLPPVIGIWSWRKKSNRIV